MTRAFEVTAAIERPVDDVWAALIDWQNAHQWMSGVEWIHADGETEVGTTLTFRARGKDRPSRIADITPGRSITLRSVQGGVTADYRYAVEPTGSGSTGMVLRADCTTTGVWTVFAPLLRGAMRRADRHQLDSFKAMVESASA